MKIKYTYDEFLNSRSKKQWERIGIKRRCGVATGLFSIYSKESCGIGEIPDITLLADWCSRNSMSIIQLLPMNDTGFNFLPYDPQSTFALEPMYLRLDCLEGVNAKSFANEIKELKKNFPAGQKRVNYAIKEKKLDLLFKLFSSSSKTQESFIEFTKENSFWLADYALFKVIKDIFNQSCWEEWPQDYKSRKQEAISKIKKEYGEKIKFYEWLQWQLYEQFRKAKTECSKKGVLIMGDLAFLVSRDSSDVWSHQDYFKLSLSAGAPPDMLFSNGQRWGMPPYNWNIIEKNNYDYLIKKLKYAENFYDLFRVDHSVGFFRVWTIPLTEPKESAGLNGIFDPKNEAEWESHGKNLLNVILDNTLLLPCAEDLGIVPSCSFKVLKELSIPGIDVQRWTRDWGKTYAFKDPAEYRKNSVATIATHDMSNLMAWWKSEAGTVDENLFLRKCREKNIDIEHLKNKIFDLKKSFHGRLRWRRDIKSTDVLFGILGTKENDCYEISDLYKSSFNEEAKFEAFLNGQKKDNKLSDAYLKNSAFEKVNHSSSIFSIQLLHDWLSFSNLFKGDPWDLRINFPGTLSDKNWSLVMPVSLEDMMELEVNKDIKKLNIQTARF